MLLNALLVALVYYIAATANIMFGVWHIARPIVIAPLVGLVLGDLQTGIILGATFEAAFLGVIAVGGSMPADPTLGAVFGTSVSIIGGVTSEVALSIGVPVAILGMSLSAIPMFLIFPFTQPIAQKCAERGDAQGLKRMTLTMGALMSFFTAIIVFLGVYMGAEAVGGLMETLPMWIVGGLTVAGKLLPAIGFALLLNLLFSKKVIAFFFLGYVLAMYLALPSIVIAVMAIVLGIYTYYNMPQNKMAAAVPALPNNAVETEDFFE